MLQWTYSPKFQTAKKIFDRILTVAAIILIVVAGMRAFRSNAKFEKAPEFVLPLLDATPLNSSSLNGKTVIVFWATWCGPCRFELARLQRAVESHSIVPCSILAIDSYESPYKVRQVVADRGYTFPVAVDSSGEVAGHYHVEATPTVVFREADGRVNWMTSGISPLLELRASRFLGSK